jgi:NADH:ubiquinone oxidoreductase subunit E
MDGAILPYTEEKGVTQMAWDLNEAVTYYKRNGAPSDQSALIGLLGEVQETFGGIPSYLLPEIAESLGTKQGVLLALIKRIPRLRLSDVHTLEVCAGPNCPKRADLAGIAENLCKGKNVQLKLVPCMRMCGKGPNIRFDGVVYNGADEALLKKLING